MTHQPSGPTLDDSVRAAAYPVRRIVVLVLAFLAPAVGYGQMALDLGLSPGEFAADGDETLRVAGYAFAIWGLIYLAMLAHGVWQALPGTPESPLLRRFGWPSAAALAGISLWIVASAADAQWASVIIIFASALALLAPLLSGAAELAAAGPRQRVGIAWPLALLAGWLTIASVVNLVTVLTSQGLLPGSPGPQAWGVMAVVAVAGFAAWVTWRTRLWIYALPIVWGLVGAFAAEQAEGDNLLAFTALAAAFALAVAAALLTRRRPI